MATNDPTLEARMAQLLKMRAAVLQRTDPARFAALQRNVAMARMQAGAEQARIAYPVPYGGLGGLAVRTTSAAARSVAAERMKAAVLQRTDPARFAALQRNVAMARMQAGAEQARIAYPVPYGGLGGLAVRTTSAAARSVAAERMKAAVLQRTDPARFAALQRNVAMARMQAGAEQARIAYPVPYGGLGGLAVRTTSAAARSVAAERMKAAVLQRTDPARFAALQRNVAMARMQAGAEQARIAYPVPYGGLGGLAVRTTSAAALRSQSRRRRKRDHSSRIRASPRYSGKSRRRACGWRSNSV